jgi:phosphoserine aminotransferase
MLNLFKNINAFIEGEFYAKSAQFLCGPAILPVEVVEETRDAVMNFQNTGMSIKEISHRSKEFDAVIKEAQSDALK